MTTSLSDAGYELYEQMTARTFYVVDTEYTAAGDDIGGNRIISIGIVPVTFGNHTASADLYKVMHPGCLISAGSTKVHGFTDGSVKGKQHFDFYAPAILAAFADPDGIFVAHTAADIRALRGELARLDTRKAAGDPKATRGLADLPDMPILDTSRLARQVRYPGIGNRSVVKLGKLCELTGVSLGNAHNALADARATADALLELLAHAAQHAVYWDLNSLIADNNAGTTHDPKGPAFIRSARENDPVLPPEHVAKHLDPLSEAGTDAQRKAWLDLAAECASLRCQWLRDEARVAAPDNAAALLDDLVALLPKMAEPGQAGTLLGAVYELINPTPESPELGLANSRALKWWTTTQPKAAASPACGDSSATACPTCREGQPCPRDILHQPVTRIAVYAGKTDLTRERMNKLLAPSSDQRINRWNHTHPDCAAYAAWLVVSEAQALGREDWAMRYLTDAVAMNLHLVEPRLTVMAAETMTGTNGLDATTKTVEAILSARTTDDGYDELALWLMWTQQALAASVKKQPKPESKFPRLARPAGRVPENPYIVN
jgi:DNA polymerase III epsilon subunit-like protein